MDTDEVDRVLMEACNTKSRVVTQSEGINRLLVSISCPPNPYGRNIDGHTSWHCPLPPRLDYRYREEAGEGVTVYLVDTGADINHETYRHTNSGTRRWLFSPKDKLHQFIDSCPNHHGTAMLDILAGPEHGVAKKVDVVVCPLSHVSCLGQSRQPGDIAKWYEEMFLAIEDDIKRHGLQGRAVVSWSGSILFAKDGGVFDDQYTDLTEIFERISKLGVLFVVAGVSKTERDAKPHLRHQPQDSAYYDLPILVVDAVCDTGRLAQTRDVNSTIAAWGEVKKIAGPGGRSAYQSMVGTSVATAALGGIAAGILSEKSTLLAMTTIPMYRRADLLMSYIKYLARKPWDGCEVDIAWNGVDWQQDEYDDTGPVPPTMTFAEWFDAWGIIDVLEIREAWDCTEQGLERSREF